MSKAAYEQLIPRIQGLARRRLWGRARENAERFGEMMQEILCLTFDRWCRDNEKGRDHLSIGKMVDYAIREVVVGGGVMGRILDDCLSFKQHHLRGSLDRLSENGTQLPATTGWTMRSQSSPFELVRIRIDWSQFLKKFPRRTQQIVTMLDEGYSRTEIAKAIGITKPAVTRRLDKVRQLYEEIFGLPEFEARARQHGLGHAHVIRKRDDVKRIRFDSAPRF